MVLNNDYYNKTEQVIMLCRTLYAKYGYRQYKMSKFEEYDLYAENKDFLANDSIITFTERNGKLMALKPDVTISIVKNTPDNADSLNKVYYNESVYHISGHTNEFKESMQLGLECVGDIDVYSMSEVISLAVRSLAYISDDYILDISHIGFINGLLDETCLPDDQKKALTNALNLKNSSAIGKICEKGKVEPKICEALMSLTTLYGPIADTIPRLEKFNFNEKTADAIDELKNIYKILTAMNCSDNINLNCSIENDMNYYNGITFHGFVGGVPFGVVSGGRYDKLVRKFGKRGGAIGFAIYLDRLESLFTSSKDYDVDVLLLYDKDTDRIKLAKLVERFVAEGKSVTADTRIPSAIRYRTVVKPDDTEVE